MRMRRHLSDDLLKDTDEEVKAKVEKCSWSAQKSKCWLNPKKRSSHPDPRTQLTLDAFLVSVLLSVRLSASLCYSKSKLALNAAWQGVYVVKCWIRGEVTANMLLAFDLRHFHLSAFTSPLKVLK